MLGSIGPQRIVRSGGVWRRPGRPDDSVADDDVAKAGFDLAVAGAALAVLLPYMAFLALLVKLDSPGPAIYRAVRIGQGGQPFVMYKFRSMREEPKWGLRVTSASDRALPASGGSCGAPSRMNCRSSGTSSKAI